MKNILKFSMAFSSACFLFFSMPIYDLPFSGCETTGFFTSDIFCSFWYEFFRGFFAMLAFIVIVPKRPMLIAIGMFPVMAISLLGGVYSVRHGNFLYVESLQEITELIYTGLPLALGGLLPLSVYLIWRCWVYISERLSWT